MPTYFVVTLKEKNIEIYRINEEIPNSKSGFVRRVTNMSNDKVFQMDFGKIYGLLLDKSR